MAKKLGQRGKPKMTSKSIRAIPKQLQNMIEDHGAAQPKLRAKMGKEMNNARAGLKQETSYAKRKRKGKDD